MAEPNLTDLLRRLDNLLRLGTIAEVNHTQAKARVKSGEIITDWLPWLTCRAGSSQTWSPPTIGEQCILLAISGELTTAVILTGIYIQNAPTHSADEHCFVFADGAEIKYNHASGHLSAINCKTAEIQASTSITAKTPTLICTGNVEIHGNLSVQGQISTEMTITARGEISGNGISLSTHKHAGVERGSKKTDTPS